MKEEDLSRIKQYPIVEYLESKGIKPVRRTSVYALYRSPLRAETHPSFKVDTEKNLWIDYAECRAARYRKPSTTWGRTLPIIQYIVLTKTSHKTISNQRWLQTRQGN